MRNLINSGGGDELLFAGNKIRIKMRLSSRFCVFCGAKRKTCKNQPGAAPEHLKLATFGFRNKYVITKCLPILSTPRRAILCFHPHEVAHAD